MAMQMMFGKCLIACFFLLFSSTNNGLSANQLYKYKDKNGNWVFTDKAPQSKQQIKTIEYTSKKKATLKPSAYTLRENDTNILVFDNPYHAPVEVEIVSEVFKDGKYKELIEATSKKAIFKSAQKIPEYTYRWVLGAPSAKEEPYKYAFPVSSKVFHRITQSFSGRFSHFRQPNIHAVDIATPVGTYISAARAGVVIWVKDDYHMGGQQRFFLDKANYVKILHDDGTYAVYAHILLGSALVKPGDIVARGDSIARGGSTGYSTGPHLHFVIRKNVGLETRSVPFRFSGPNGKEYVPRAGMEIDGVDGSF